MQKTRREAIDDVLGFVGELNDPVARDIAERLLPRALFDIWLAHNWQQFVMPKPYVFSTVVGQSSYALPGYFGRVSQVDGKLRSLTRGREIRQTTLEALQRDHPDAGTSFEQAGPPCVYAIGGTQGVQAQPVAPGEVLEVLSDFAGDTAVRVVVEGLNDAGVFTARQVTLTGTARVGIGTWQFVQSFGKSYPAGTDPTTELQSSEGNVTLRTRDDERELMTLLPAESARDVQILTLYPKPSAVESIVVPVLRRPRMPIYDADVLPLDWSNAIFEEMVIKWRVNTGELVTDERVPRPSLARLIENDNVSRPRPMVRPFG